MAETAPWEPASKAEWEEIIKSTHPAKRHLWEMTGAKRIKLGITAKEWAEWLAAPHPLTSPKE